MNDVMYEDYYDVVDGVVSAHDGGGDLASASSSAYAELECMVQQRLWQKQQQQQQQQQEGDFCGPNFDRVSCWPSSPADTLAVIPCMGELNGVKYDTRGQ